MRKIRLEGGPEDGRVIRLGGLIGRGGTSQRYTLSDLFSAS